MNALRPQLDEILHHHRPSVDVVRSYHVVTAAVRPSHEIVIAQHYRNRSRIEPRKYPRVGKFAVACELDRLKDHPRHPAGNEIARKPFRLRRPPLGGSSGNLAEQQRVALFLRQRRHLPDEPREKFRLRHVGNYQSDLAGRADLGDESAAALALDHEPLFAKRRHRLPGRGT